MYDASSIPFVIEPPPDRFAVWESHTQGIFLGDISTEVYDAYEDFGVDQILHEAAVKTAQSLKVESFEELLAQDTEKRTVYYIQSRVGDDETTITNSGALGPLLVGTGPAISGIKLSRKDSGISPDVGNYAEGWMLTPPSAEASFEATNRRHSRSGVPWTLDAVKIKFLSAVRKQSANELDLESKLIHLAEVASWTNRDWMSFDYHQAALLMSNVIFDFSDAKSFPYLHRTEGGCGGSPPYGNVETAYSHIRRFNRGKSTKALLGVMKETVDIHLQQRKPKDCFFTRSSKIAQMGDKRWLDYVSSYKALRKGLDISDSELRDLLRGQADVSLPQDVLDLGIEIESDSPIIGSAISHLRKDGFILTELDVKSMIDNQIKTRAIGGTVPIGTVLAELDEQQRIFRSNYWRILSGVAKTEGFDEASGYTLPNTESYSSQPEIAEILHGYYAMRADSHNVFSSFEYTNTIRVFKTADIEYLLNRARNKLPGDFSSSASTEDFRIRFKTDIMSERLRKERTFDWVSKTDLRDILAKPLPAGIGPDDGRIVRNLEIAINNLSVEGENLPILVLLVTGDKKLARKTESYLREIYKEATIAFFIMSPADYVRYCLGVVTEANDPRHIPLPKMAEILIYNYIVGRETPLPVRVTEMLHEAIGPGRKTVLVEYDYPNMERFLERTSYDQKTNSVIERVGGYLPRNILVSKPGWAATPLSEMRKWACFDTSTKLRYPLRVTSYEPMVYRPMNPGVYSEVGRWRQTI